MVNDSFNVMINLCVRESDHAQSSPVRLLDAQVIFFDLCWIIV